MTRPGESWPFVFLVVACLLWGSATVLSKYLLFSVPPVALLSIQLAPSACVLWFIAGFSPARALRRSTFPTLILLGC